MKNSKYFEIIRVFFKLGLTAFGGPAAHVAMMEDELIQKRKWVTKQEFVDMFGLTSLIPGPNSTEMAIFLGYARGGVLGLILAGVCFITPALVMVISITYLYVTYGSIPSVANILNGIKPVMIAIVLNALIRLFPTVVKKSMHVLVFVGVIILYTLGINELILLFGCGFGFLLLSEMKGKVFSIEPISLMTLFLAFLKIGAVLYGSGYVLLAFLESEFVSGLGIITNQQLIDAVAIGQLTPGPVFTTAASIGYMISGLPGALVSAFGIFLPSFLIVALLNPVLYRVQKSERLKSFLRGVNIASLALMASILYRLFVTSVTDVTTALIGIGALIGLFMFKINTTYLIIGGAIIGYLFL